MQTHPRRDRKLFLLAGVALILTLVAMHPRAVAAAQTAKPDRWIHVRVESSSPKGELVRVNVPLELAEKVLPAIHKDRLRGGKLKIHQAGADDVDLRALLEAVRGARDGEFVTVQSKEQNVRVAKQNGYVLVHVLDAQNQNKHRVEIRMPMAVVEALLSSGSRDELDLVAAVRALAAHGDTELVSVKDQESTVRVWVDSKNSAD